MRRQRLHVDNGLYYLHQSTEDILCSDRADCALLWAALTAAAARCGVRVYALEVEERALRLAVQVSTIASSVFMHTLLQRYVPALQRHHARRGALIRKRHRALLVDPLYLRELVHHVHWAAVQASTAQPPARFIHSSHSLYMGGPPPAWLDTRTVLQQFHPRLNSARHLYRKAMAQPPAPHFTAGFTHGSTADPRVFGSAAFLRTLSLSPPAPRIRSFERLIELVELKLDVNRRQLLSSSRKRKLTLARALIGWQARQQGLASVAEVARYFGLHHSSLQDCMDYHSERRPELFDVAALSDAQPLLRLPGQAGWGLHH